jgi:hypothetical protein
MANFGKFGNLSLTGWTGTTSTQVLSVGQNAHIGLWGGGPAGEDLIVKAENATVCVTHEEPRPKGADHWRHFLLTALKDGETKINATLGSGGVWASMTVKVTGHSGVRLVFFPGERMDGSTTEGTIYVIGGAGESMVAAGGPPTGRNDRGGHTVEPTPAGNYVLGPRIHVVAPSWPMSAIPWGAALRINSAGEVEFEASPGNWKVATGPNGVVTNAKIAFAKRDKLNPKLADVVAAVRNVFIDSAGKLRSATWDRNDFGRWGWNLLRNGAGTAYFVHTTPADEHATEQGRAVFLLNSHGCVHLEPNERDRLMKAGYLKQGVPFEVRPYTETGPP